MKHIIMTIGLMLINYGVYMFGIRKGFLEGVKHVIAIKEKK